MLIDKRATFGGPIALLTSAPGTAKWGEALDMSVARDLGEGEPIYLRMLVGTAATSGGSATAVFELVTADNEALTTNPVVLLSTPSFAVAAMTAGKDIINVPLPKATYKRWLGIRQVTGTAAFTAGSVWAFLTTDSANWRAYADAVN
jgi:hypothetical protein